MAISENKRICREFGLLFILSGGLYLNTIFFLSPFFSFFYQGMRGSQSFGESWKGRVGWVWCEAKSLQQGWQTFCKGPDNKFSFMAMWSLLRLLYRVDSTERNGQGCVPIRLDVQQGWAWPTGCGLPTPAGVWRQRAWV